MAASCSVMFAETENDPTERECSLVVLFLSDGMISVLGGNDNGVYRWGDVLEEMDRGYGRELDTAVVLGYGGE